MGLKQGGKSSKLEFRSLNDNSGSVINDILLTVKLFGPTISYKTKVLT